MQEPEEIVCILVVYADGSECWEPMREILRNPPPGAWIKRESRKIQPEHQSEHFSV